MSVIVLFEVTFKPGCRAAYLEHAKSLIPDLRQVEGFLSAERFTSLTNPDKVLSKSVWKDESVIDYWRNFARHRLCQKDGRENLFADFQITVVTPLRTYSLNDHGEAPEDSRAYFDEKHNE